MPETPDDNVSPPSMRRFLKLDDVAGLLVTSPAQVYALVRRGDLPAIKLGGRGQWRVETSTLEAYIARQYEETRRWVQEHPFVESRKTGRPDADEDLEPATNNGDGDGGPGESG